MGHIEMGKPVNGLQFNIPEATYHQMPGLSSTGAKKLLKSPAHYQHYITHPQEPKDAFDLGSAVHTKVLGSGAQLEVIPDEVLAANGAISTKAAKEFIENARAEGRIPVKRVVADVVNRMVESVLGNPTARALFEGGHAEVSMFATDPATGVDLRGRLDYLGKRIADLKTTSGEASESGFAKSAFNFGYPVQYGQYEHIYELITGEVLPWLWVVVETEAPYITSVFVLDEDAQKMGRDMARAARERYARCRDSGIWPGYEHRNGGPIGIVRAPQYSIYDYIDNFEGVPA